MNRGVGRGCLFGIIILALFGSGIGIMVWRQIMKYRPPTELMPYTHRASTLDLLKNRDSVIAEGRHLDSADVAFYIGSLDRVNEGWNQFMAVYTQFLEKADSDDLFNPLGEDGLDTIYARQPLIARKYLVDYLNQNGRSWKEYEWIKTRVIAASGITHDEALDSMVAFMKQNRFDVEEDANPESATPLFDRVEAMRRNGIDSTEKALVAPYRTTLLTKGINALSDIEFAFYGDE